MNPYKVLGIELTATKAEILKAFRKKASEVHPDKNKSPQAAKDFQKLVKARDLLISGETDQKGYKPAAHKPKKTAEQPQKTPAQVKKEQELDQKAGKKKRFFKKESPEVKKHRQKIKTAKHRLSGKY